MLKHSMSPSAKRALILSSIFVVFALCGIFTAYNSAFSTSEWWPYYRGVLPFCVILAGLCVRPWYWIPVTIAGCLASWRLAFLVLAGMNALPGFMVVVLYYSGPGLAGALGVATSIGIGARSIFQKRKLAAVGLAGFIYAFIFQINAAPYSNYAGFAAWQAAVGTLLYYLVKWKA